MDFLVGFYGPAFPIGEWSGSRTRRHSANDFTTKREGTDSRGRYARRSFHSGDNRVLHRRNWLRDFLWAGAV